MSWRKVPGGRIDASALHRLAEGIEEASRRTAARVVDGTVERIAVDARREVPQRSGRLFRGVVNLDRSSGDIVRRVTGITGPAGVYGKFVWSSRVGRSDVGARKPRHIMTAHFRKPTTDLRKALPVIVVEAIAKDIENG
jgi:hypothetical protein